MATALVTGATRGVGRAVAVTLARAGHAVLALGRDRDRLDQLAGMVDITPLAVDLTDRGALLEAAAGREVDVLVNNAGVMPPLGPLHEADQVDLDLAIEVNFTAHVALTRALVPGMVERGQGHVFFTGSIAGHAPSPNVAVYCATKAALSGFAQALRLDLAPHGVRVTEIVAGRVETEMYRDLLPADVRSAMYEGEGAAVQPQDVAEMVTAVLAMPPRVDVARFDILPTRPTVPTGTRAGESGR